MATDGMSRWLESLDDERLRALVERRLGRVHRLPSSFDQLASLLSQPHACDDAVRALDRSAVQVAALLAERGGRCTADELALALGLSSQVAQVALERAAVQALTWPGADGTWRAAAGLRHYAPVLLARGPSYLQLLERMRLQGVSPLEWCSSGS